MNSLKFSFAIFTIAYLTSCSMQQGASNSTSVESDDVYYQAGESFISDFAQVDDPESVSVDPPVAETVDEYYTPESTPAEVLDEGIVTQNYYGNVYNYGNMNSGNNPGFYSGFNNGWYNPWQPNLNLAWDPWRGWHMSYNYNNFGWGSYWNDPWGWNSPCYDPWYYNSWCWNNWNTPYGYYNPNGWNNSYCGYGNYWNNGYGSYNYNDWNTSLGDNFTYGNRPSVTVGSAINSSYTNGEFNAGRLQHKPMPMPDVVTEVERIKDDYNQIIANDNFGLNTPDRTPSYSPTSGYQTTVGSKPLSQTATTNTKPAVAKEPIRTDNNNAKPSASKPERIKIPSSKDVDRPRTNAPVTKPLPSAPSKPSAPATRPTPSKPAPSNPAPSKPAPSAPGKRKAPESASLSNLPAPSPPQRQKPVSSESTGIERRSQDSRPAPNVDKAPQPKAPVKTEAPRNNQGASSASKTNTPAPKPLNNGSSPIRKR